MTNRRGKFDSQYMYKVFLQVPCIIYFRTVKDYLCTWKTVCMTDGDPKSDESGEDEHSLYGS